MVAVCSHLLSAISLFVCFHFRPQLVCSLFLDHVDYAIKGTLSFFGLFQSGLHIYFLKTRPLKLLFYLRHGAVCGPFFNSLPIASSLLCRSIVYFQSLKFFGGIPWRWLGTFLRDGTRALSPTEKERTPFPVFAAASVDRRWGSSKRCQTQPLLRTTAVGVAS